MKHWFTLALILGVGCSSSSPTAPTPPSVNVPSTPPVVSVPSTPTTPPPPPAFPPNDARFDLTFYRQFVHNVREGPTYNLFRQREAPRIYLRTIHADGRPIDAITLDETAASLINTTGALTGVFGLAGLERGTGTRAGQPGWITVSWVDDPEKRYCGRATVGGDWVDLYPNTPGCRCAGNRGAIDQSTVKHELGHALGFYHTDHVDDLMYFRNLGECSKSPTAREIYHAAVAYTRPIGSPAP